MIVGIFGAIAQSDIKRLLSFTLVSHIGYMIFGIALSSEIGMSAAIYYVAHHILVQTTLFLVVGLIERQAGSASLRRLGGLIASPVLAALFLIPALNLGGIPPFSGFLGKVALIEAGTSDGSVLAWILVAGSVVTSLLTLYVVARIWTKGFWRPRADAPEGELSDSAPSALIDESDDIAFDERADVGRMPVAMVIPTALMVAAGLALTVWAGPIFGFTDRAATDIIDRDIYVSSVLGGR
jgi:multicomponent Na+:H+ antiporter subunit D